MKPSFSTAYAFHEAMYSQRSPRAFTKTKELNTHGEKQKLVVFVLSPEAELHRVIRSPFEVLTRVEGRKYDHQSRGLIGIWDSSMVELPNDKTPADATFWGSPAEGETAQRLGELSGLGSDEISRPGLKSGGRSF